MFHSLLQDLPNGSVAVDVQPVHGVGGHGMVNGFEDLTLESGSGGQEGGVELLSSSLEAEQRLLREMGWSEDDEQNSVTEEVMLEMQQLSKDLKQVRKV